MGLSGKIGIMKVSHEGILIYAPSGSLQSLAKKKRARKEALAINILARAVSQLRCIATDS